MADVHSDPTPLLTLGLKAYSEVLPQLELSECARSMIRLVQAADVEVDKFGLIVPKIAAFPLGNRSEM
jgi:hypothetical protein